MQRLQLQKQVSSEGNLYTNLDSAEVEGTQSPVLRIDIDQAAYGNPEGGQLSPPAINDHGNNTGTMVWHGSVPSWKM